MVAYPDRGAFFWEGRSLSPQRLNIFTVGSMGVMICLDQGGLRTLSASSLLYNKDKNASFTDQETMICYYAAFFNTVAEIITY